MLQGHVLRNVGGKCLRVCKCLIADCFYPAAHSDPVRRGPGTIRRTHNSAPSALPDCKCSFIWPLLAEQTLSNITSALLNQTFQIQLLLVVIYKSDLRFPILLIPIAISYFNKFLCTKIMRVRSLLFTKF